MVNAFFAKHVGPLKFPAICVYVKAALKSCKFTLDGVSAARGVYSVSPSAGFAVFMSFVPNAV